MSTLEIISLVLQIPVVFMMLSPDNSVSKYPVLTTLLGAGLCIYLSAWIRGASKDWKDMDNETFQYHMIKFIKTKDKLAYNPEQN